MKKIAANLFGSFVVLIVLMSMISIADSDSPSVEFKPVDLCMVIDKSGSMNGPMGDKSKMQGAKEAAKDVISVLLPQDRISIVSFSSTATTEVGFASDFRTAKSKINQISTGGGTSFGAGLESALNQFDTRGNPDHIPAILFMSDGEHNTRPDPYSYVVQCKNRGIPIFTVGFAATESQVDVENLTMMADATSGEYVFVDDIFDLENAFLKLHDKASGWDPISEYMGKVSPGRTAIAGTFEVAAYVACLRFTLNWPGSDMDLILYDPSGEEVDFNASYVIYSRDTKPEYVIINDPEPGTWTTMVYGKELDCTEDYYLLVSSYEPPQPKRWSKTFGGSGDDLVFSVQQTRDDGYIIAGSTRPYGAGDEDLWLIKTDLEGNVEWDKTFGGEGFDRGTSVQQIGDSAYIVVGGGSEGGWLLQIDSKGSKEWEKYFQGAGGNSIQQTRDGGYIIVGGKSINDVRYSDDIWLVKTDSYGNKEWVQNFGGPEFEVGYSVQQTRDGGYIITGIKALYGGGNERFWLIKTDSYGNKVWDQTFLILGPGWGGNCVQQTSDGGYIITGSGDPYGAGHMDVWLIKTDSLGNKEWDRTFGGTGSDWGSSVKTTYDGGFIIAGGTFSYGRGKSDIWLIKTDSEGHEEWNRTFGGENKDMCPWDMPSESVIQQARDGGYIIVGTTESSRGDDDIRLIKTDSEGYTIIPESNMSVEEVPQNDELFKVTADKYSETADLDQVIKNEFGYDYRLADWNDVLARSYVRNCSIQSWASSVGMKCGDSYLISSDGRRFWNNGRHYFMTRHDHVCEGSFLVHDQINNHFIDLGSWYGIRMPILCIKTTEATPILSCTGSISGYVYDTTGKGIDDLIVACDGTSISGLGAGTHDGGYYDFSYYHPFCPSTTYSLYISPTNVGYLGYNPISLKVTTDTNGNAILDFYLQCVQ